MWASLHHLANTTVGLPRPVLGLGSSASGVMNSLTSHEKDARYKKKPTQTEIFLKFQPLKDTSFTDANKNYLGKATS